MLIKIPEHHLRGIARDKNPYWESLGLTPNEAKDVDPHYKRALKGFIAHNRVTGPHRFFEVRIVNNKPLIDVLHQNWWEHPAFMDKVYWMFQRPSIILLEDQRSYPLYVLEPMECWRIQNIIFKLTGKPTNGDPRTAFVVPVDCCQLAWTETKAGISEHIHYRPKLALTQAQIDKESTRKLEVEKVLENSMDLSDILPDSIT